MPVLCVSAVAIILPSEPFSLYVHIPFCQKKCPYCAFYKELWSEEKELDFVRALQGEIEAYRGRGLSFKTLFFGGGTPSKLSLNRLKEIFSSLEDVFSFTTSCEKTMECNPESLTNELLDLLAEYHFNRISLGIQSFHPEELAFLGRRHSSEQIHAAIKRVQLHPQVFSINLDFIFSTPISTLDTLRFTIDKALSYKPQHLSCYALSIEEGTIFEKNAVKPLDDDSELLQYKLIQQLLGNEGYQQYEVSAFAKPGFECEHNLAYWRYNDFLGLGPSANSFVGGYRASNVSDHLAYVRRPYPALLEIKEPSSVSDQMRECFMSNLRLKEGLNIDTFEKRFPVNFHSFYEQPLQKYINEGFLFYDANILKTTDNGLYLLNEMLQDFLL